MNLIRKKKPTHLAPELVDLLDMIWDRHDHIQSDRLDALGSCLKKLPPKIKQAIELRYYQGQDSQRVADQLGLSINTVYIYVSKAHGLLKDCINQYLSSNSSAVEGLND